MLSCLFKNWPGGLTLQYLIQKLVFSYRKFVIVVFIRLNIEEISQDNFIKYSFIFFFKKNTA